MKKIISMMAVVLVSLTVAAEQYFSIVNTVAYAAQDTSPSDAHANRYSGYLCTVESAANLFGGKTSAADITSYVSSHYASVLENLGDEAGLGSVYALAADAEGYSFGQYAVSAYTTAALSGDYLALMLYSDGENEAFRAFGLGSSSAVGGGMTFDDNGLSAATATVGAWTAVIPEPTGGFLLLLGVAALALRRKRTNR